MVHHRRSAVANRALEAARALCRAPHLGVTGVDFGLAHRAGAPRGYAVRFHVAKKTARAALPASALLPTDLHGVPCDVREARFRPHGVNPRAHFDPLVAGISLGNERGATGTLGAFVRSVDAEPGEVCALSAWHVLAGPLAAVGDAIVQPGPRDASAAQRRPIGALLRWLEPSSGLDAAIATLAVPHHEATLGLDLTTRSVDDLELGETLRKCGAASGVTRAAVDGVDGSYLVDYGALGDGPRWMEGVHMAPDPAAPLDEISLEGDSGAVWRAASGAAVALHFAGEDGLGRAAEYGLAHRIGQVLAALGVELL